MIIKSMINSFSHRGKKIVKFKSYEEALSMCGKYSYQDVELCELVVKKTIQKEQKLKEEAEHQVLYNSDVLLPSLLYKICFESGKDILKVLDFGGGGGIHFFNARVLFKNRLNFEWCVVETIKMVDSAKAVGLEKGGLSFEKNIDKVNFMPDVIFSSGALQYVDDPFRYIDKIISKNSEYILFTRLMLSVGNDILYTVQKSMLSQNGPGLMPEGYDDRELYYPHTTMPLVKFLEKMLDKYLIEWEINDESGIHYINEKNIIGKSFLFKRNAKVDMVEK